jgi:hypothetical protein
MTSPAKDPEADQLPAHHACRKWTQIVPPAADPPGGDGMQVLLLRFGSV